VLIRLPFALALAFLLLPAAGFGGEEPEGKQSPKPNPVLLARADGAQPPPLVSANTVVLAEIAGIVATQSGQPLPGALVSVAAENEGGSRFAVTDNEGRFHIQEAAPGRYSLRAYLAGFLPSREARVRVSSGVISADTLLLRMAAVAAGPSTGSLSELRWLLQRGRRHVLREREATLRFEEDPFDLGWDAPGSPLPGALEGEFGFFAGSGSNLGFSEGSAVDSGVAYTRFELPSTARGDWRAEVRLMESAMASWAASVSYQMDESDGHAPSAGIGYQRHVYRDTSGLRPPEAPILDADLLHAEEAEWDGAAFVADEFTTGRTTVSTGLTYRRFSYLGGQSGFAPRAVIEYRAGENWSILSGMAARVDAPLGEDPALLSRVAFADLLAVDPARFRRSPAQRSVRWQAGASRSIGEQTTLGARAFHETTTDQLMRTFESRPYAGGRFHIRDAGDFSARGFAVDLIRELSPVHRRLDLGGRVSFVMAVVREEAPGASGLVEEGLLAAPAGLLAPEDGAPLQDLSAEVSARVRPSGTRFHAVYRLIRHPGLIVGPNRDGSSSRFELELVQLVPFADWSGTEWELSVAIRDLFFQDLLGRSLLDELAVANAPRRVIGGLAVRF